MCVRCASSHSTGIILTNHRTVPVKHLQELQCTEEYKQSILEGCHDFICEEQKQHKIMASSDSKKERQQRVDSLLEKSKIKLDELLKHEKKVQQSKEDLENLRQKLHCMTCPNYSEQEDPTAFEELCQDVERVINDEHYGDISLGTDTIHAKPLTDSGKDRLKRKKDNEHKKMESKNKELKRKSNTDETLQQGKHTCMTGKKSKPGTSATTSVPMKLTASGGASTSATASATSISLKSLTLIKTFHLPAPMEGMDSVNKDTVVVCFGGPRSSLSGKEQSATYFSISKEQKQPLNATITKASDIIHLQDGRLVAAHEEGTLKIYTADGSQTSDFTSSSVTGFCQLCSDLKNNIYVASSTPKILKYHPDGEEVEREIKTGKIKPEQICVTADGAYLVTTNSSSKLVTIFDKDGKKTDAITGNPFRSLNAAIDAEGRVLVAAHYVQSDVVKLSLDRYCLQEGKFQAKEQFSAVKLSPQSPPDTKTLPWSYMVSLSPTMLVFAYDSNLHFIQVQE